MVALLATRLKDWGDIFGKRHGSGGWLRSGQC